MTPFFKIREKKVRGKKKEGVKCFPPAERHLSYGPLSADKLILEIRGHFLRLHTASSKDTRKSLRGLARVRAEHVCVYVSDL